MSPSVMRFGVWRALQLVCLAAWLSMLDRDVADRDVIAMKPSLVRISGHGRSVEVGGYLPRAARPQLAEEFRWALRHLDD